MQKIGIIPIGKEGKHIANILAKQLKGDQITRSDVGMRWADFDAFIFIGAMGICVRTIAPHIKDKHTDPAVICIDSNGKEVVSVLSGPVYRAFSPAAFA